jgi:hypothetical protein
MWSFSVAVKIIRFQQTVHSNFHSIFRFFWFFNKDNKLKPPLSGGEPQGAMSFAMLKVLQTNPHVTYAQLLQEMRQALKKSVTRFTQVPTKSSSLKMCLFSLILVIGCCTDSSVVDRTSIRCESNVSIVVCYFGLFWSLSSFRKTESQLLKIVDNFRW